MKKTIGATIALSYVLVAVSALQGQQPAGDGPRYQDGNQLVRPTDYREWPFLGAGLGLTYDAERGPGAQNAPQNFSNVFVNPSSYRHFMQTGTWKDGTVFILEIRGSGTGTAPNTTGRFQTAMVALEAEVKDAKLPNGWAYYEFGRANALREVAAPLTGQREAGCIECHTKHTAVERTFVQFYPHLLEVAKAKGTAKPGY
jgi:Cytochrome P460